MQLILSDFFKSSKDNIKQVTYLTLGTIASSYDNVNLGMADQMVIKSIAQSTKQSEQQVKSDYNKRGDLGNVAEQDTKNKRATLKVTDVFTQLHAIAETSGSGSQSQKIEILANLLSKSTAVEAKYITRIALGTLRMGVGDMTILNALAIAFSGGKSGKSTIEQAYNVCPDIGVIAEAVIKNKLSAIKPMIGRPIKVMLCQRAESITEIKKRMPSGMIAEEKYDGERVQIHKETENKKGKESNVTLFSRRMENTTHQFPEIVEEIKKLKGEFIIEGEIVAIDKQGNMLDFQTLMQRRRKHNIEEYQSKVPAAVMLFDILYFDGKSLLNKPLEERQGTLKNIIGKSNSTLKFTRRIKTTNVEEVEEFFTECLERDTEGIIVKSKISPYEAGTRGYNWIKWKPEYTHLRDTFDLVIVGGFAGRGRRAQTYGALLCACYNKKKDTFETFCKLGSGFTDVQLEELPKKLQKYKVPSKPSRLTIHQNMKPDVWFEPKVVIEVTGAEITKSPLHTAAETEGTGFALRFPRFLRYRTDKTSEQATTTDEILKMSK